MDTLIDRFKSRQGVVGIIGLGYVGLPLAATFAEAGFSVIGFDVDAAKIKELGAGRSYIRHVPSERLVKVLRADAFRPKAEIGLFAIHEECRVESAQLFPQPATKEKEATADDVNLAFLAAIPASIGLWIEER